MTLTLQGWSTRRSIDSLMVQSIRVTGRTICDMGKALRSGQMGLAMKVFGGKIKLMEKESFGM